MQNEYMEHALARLLKLKRHQIGEWRMVGQSAGSFARSRIGMLGVAGAINADLEVGLIFESAEQSAAFVGALQGRIFGSVILQRAAEADHHHPYRVLQCQLALLYGKETQHLFKALAQQFVVRGRPPKKRRRK